MMEREQGVQFEYGPPRRHRLGSRHDDDSEASAEKKQGISEHIALLPSLHGSVKFVQAKIVCRKTVQEEISRQVTLATQLRSRWQVIKR